MYHILLVDDEPEVTNALSRVLRKEYKISTCNQPHDVMALLKEQRFNLILSDIRMPNMDGIELLTQIKERYPTIERVLLSGYADMEQSQQAIKDNVARIIMTKPWDNFELKSILKIILDAHALNEENAQLKREMALLKQQCES